MILEEISRQGHRGWASCAAVCKEWQAVIEPKNFRQLSLQTSCLGNLNIWLSDKGLFVQYICLNIELPRYTCRSCQKIESMTCISRHSSLVGSAILKLFSILNTWRPAGCLTLELHAYSPSDSEHWFKSHPFGHDRKDARDLIQQQEAITEWHDPSHGWIDGRQVQVPRTPAILRLFSPLCLSLPENIPKVHAVTGLVIRRKLRRQISPPALRILWERLPSTREYSIRAMVYLAQVVEDCM